MKFQKIIIKLISILIGLLILTLGINWASKPSNYPLRFDPVDSIQNYLFVFTYTLGDLGYILAFILLAIYIALFIFLGNWIYKQIAK